MKKIVTTLGILAVLSPFMSHAAVQSGVYTGASIGNTDLESEFDSAMYDESSITNKDFEETAYSVYVGYRLNPYLATEFAYTDLGEAEYWIGTNKAEWDFSTMSLSAIGIVPLTDNFELFAQLGAHRWSADLTATDGSVDVDGTDMFYGAGLSYYMNNVSFRAEYKQLTLDKDDVDIKPSIYSVGVQYNF